jgi:hypothetical protein
VSDSRNPSPDDEAAPRSASWRRRVEEFKEGLDQRVRQQTDAAQDGARAAAGHVRDLRGSMEELAGELTDKWEQVKPGGPTPDEAPSDGPAPERDSSDDTDSNGPAVRFAQEFSERFEREVAADDVGKAWQERVREFRDNTHDWADQFAQRWANEEGDEDAPLVPDEPTAPVDPEPAVAEAQDAASAAPPIAQPPTATHEPTPVLDAAGARDEPRNASHQLPAPANMRVVLEPAALVASARRRSPRPWRYGIGASLLATVLAVAVWVVLRPPGAVVPAIAQATPAAAPRSATPPIATPDVSTYALLVGVNEYDHHANLVNPLVDVRAISEELRRHYGAETDLLENPTRVDFLTALQGLATRAYTVNSQLLVVFAGHGWFDTEQKRGFLALKDSKPFADDPLRDSLVPHEVVRTVLERLDCPHVLLMVDSCFGGTLDYTVAMARSGELYRPVSRPEYLRDKLRHRTRLYLSAGGREYVPDGRPGQHSPFTRGVLEGLRSYGGEYGVLTIEQLYYVYLDKVRPRPILGELDGNEPGSSFAFVAADAPAELPSPLQYGDLSVSVAPGDAMVTLSPTGTSVRGESAIPPDTATVGVRRFHVPVGEYALYASQDGYIEFSGAVNVEPGETAMDVRLEAE